MQLREIWEIWEIKATKIQRSRNNTPNLECWCCTRIYKQYPNNQTRRLHGQIVQQKAAFIELCHQAAWLRPCSCVISFWPYRLLYFLIQKGQVLYFIKPYQDCIWITVNIEKVRCMFVITLKAIFRCWCTLLLNLTNSKSSCPSLL